MSHVLIFQNCHEFRIFSNCHNFSSIVRLNWKQNQFLVTKIVLNNIYWVFVTWYSSTDDWWSQYFSTNYFYSYYRRVLSSFLWFFLESVKIYLNVSVCILTLFPLFISKYFGAKNVSDVKSLLLLRLRHGCLLEPWKCQGKYKRAIHRKMSVLCHLQSSSLVTVLTWINAVIRF